MERICARNDCSKQGEYKCGRCFKVFYCSRDCQVADWKSNHKNSCVKPTENATNNTNSSLKDSSASKSTKSTDSDYTKQWDDSRNMLGQIFSMMGGGGASADLNYKWIKAPLLEIEKDPRGLKLQVTMTCDDKKSIVKEVEVPSNGSITDLAQSWIAERLYGKQLNEMEDEDDNPSYYTFAVKYKSKSDKKERRVALAGATLADFEYEVSYNGRAENLKNGKIAALQLSKSKNDELRHQQTNNCLPNTTCLLKYSGIQPEWGALVEIGQLIPKQNSPEYSDIEEIELTWAKRKPEFKIKVLSEVPIKTPQSYLDSLYD